MPKLTPEIITAIKGVLLLLAGLVVEWIVGVLENTAGTPPI